MAETTKKTQKEWAKMKPEEIEAKVVELGKQNIPSAKIGLMLRDEQGIPKVKMFGKKITQILKENNIQTPEEKENKEKKIENLKKHFEAHKHDYAAQRSIVKHNARLNKLKKLAH